VIFIVFATFYDVGKNLPFLDNKLSKLALLALVVIALIIDLHTGIILLIAFLMLMIQFNNIVVGDIRNKNKEMFLSLRPASFEDKEQKPTTVQCDNIKKNEISCNIVNHTMDPESNVDYNVDQKVKPYEVFVKMMTTQEHLEKASNSAFI
jgi:hypothetical protein